MAGNFKHIETYERRFGNIALEKGVITPQQFADAMNIQVMEEIQEGKHRLIGKILFDLKYIAVEQIEDVLSELSEAR